MVSHKTPDERRAAIKAQIEKLDVKIAKKKESIEKHKERRKNILERVGKKEYKAEIYAQESRERTALIDGKIDKIRMEIEKHEAQKIKLQAKHDAVKDKAAPKEKKPRTTRKAPKLVIVETESVESAPKEKKPRTKKAPKAEKKPAEKAEMEKMPRTKKAAKAEMKPAEKKPRTKKAPKAEKKPAEKKEKVNKAPAMAETAAPADVPLAPALPPVNTTLALPGAVKKSRAKPAKKTDDITSIAQSVIDMEGVTKKNINNLINKKDKEISEESSREAFSQEDANARERRVDELKKERKVLTRARGLLKKK